MESRAARETLLHLLTYSRDKALIGNKASQELESLGAFLNPIPDDLQQKNSSL